MGILLVLLFILLYGLGLYYWDKKVSWRLNPEISQTLKYIHYIGLVLCVMAAILYSNYSLRLSGLWTTRSIILLTLLTGLFLKLIAAQEIFSQIEKWYFRICSFIPILTAAFLLIPFIGVVAILSFYGQFVHPASEIFYTDENIRVQSTFLGVLGPHRVDVYEKKGIFEKHVKRMNYWATDIDSIQVNYDWDSTRIIAYGLYDYEEGSEEKTEVVGIKKVK